jgi:hypothetical protein
MLISEHERNEDTETTNWKGHKSPLCSRGAALLSPWHSTAGTVGGQEWCEPSTAAHQPGTGTA